MSTLDINEIRDYLLQVGYKIEYPILVNAFKKHLYNPDPNVQGHIRTQFKDYVNRLATVSLENNMKFIILRPEFRPQTTTEDQPDSTLQRQMNQKQVSPKQYLQPQLPQQQQQQQQQPIQYTPQQHYQPPPPPQQQPYEPSHKQQSPPNNHHKQSQHDRHQQRPFASLNGAAKDARDSVSMPPPPTPPPPQPKPNQQPNYPPTPMRRPESLNLSSTPATSNQSLQMPPPRPPPRRRQSTASLFKQVAKPIEKSNEINDLAKKSPGRVREHALKFNSSFSSSTNLHSPIPIRNSAMMMKENRLSRDSNLGGSLASVVLQRNGSHLTNRSRSSHREDESDSSSLQPIDPLRRKWALEACNCNYNGLMTLLREEPRLASYKDIVNGYTALHWAAKFGNLDIIKLIAGTHGVSPNIKSSAGYTPLHVANMFNRKEAASLLMEIYKANPEIRDHSGKKAMQYINKEICNMTTSAGITAGTK